MFLAGNAVFTAASLLAGVATGPGMLITARFLQGWAAPWPPRSCWASW
ncbi:hypothetical protein ACFQX6_42060 [Streptosporangium lutulentum]